MGLTAGGNTKIPRSQLYNQLLDYHLRYHVHCPFSMICDSDNPTTTGAGSSENRSWLTRHPLHRPTSQTGMLFFDAQHRISRSVNYGHGVVSKKSRRDHRSLCSSKKDRRRGRVGSKWQKCRRTTIREPLAKCEGSPATS